MPIAYLYKFDAVNVMAAQNVGRRFLIRHRYNANYMFCCNQRACELIQSISAGVFTRIFEIGHEDDIHLIPFPAKKVFNINPKTAKSLIRKYGQKKP